jgi:hypothetical protein
MLVEMDFEAGDLDIYVPTSQDDTMLTIAKRQLRFREFAYTTSAYNINSSIKKIHHLRKKGKRMNLVVVKGEEPTVAIFQFQSTVVMNYLSASEIYCAYPSLTMHRLSVVNVPVLIRESQRPGGRDRIYSCLEKYFARGISFKSDVKQFNGHTHHNCHTDAECPLTIRTNFDEKGLRATLFPLTEAEETRLTLNKHMVVWALGGPKCGSTCTFFKEFAFSVKASVMTVSISYQSRWVTDGVPLARYDSQRRNLNNQSRFELGSITVYTKNMCLSRTSLAPIKRTSEREWNGRMDISQNEFETIRSPPVQYLKAVVSKRESL